MRKRRVKLIWGASGVIRGRWFAGLFGFYDRVHGDRESGLAISVRGLLIWGCGLAVLLYVAGATALYQVWRGRPYNELTYADALLYPIRRAEIAEKKGRAFIAEGTVLFREQKFVDAANLLRLGLARQPHDLPARQLLAQFYLMANQRPHAARLLTEGLQSSYPGRPYLETLFNVLEQGEDYGAVIATADRYIPQLGDEAQRREQRWLQQRKFSTLLAAGRAADALTLAETLPAGDTSVELRVLALLALQRAPAALTVLAEAEDQPAIDRRIILRLRVRALREAAQFEAMEQALAQLAALSPADPAVAVYGVVQRALAGQPQAAAALDEYFFRFGGSAENLLLAASPLAEINNLPLLERCVGAAAERGYPLPRFHTLLVQTQVTQGQWAAAAGVLARMPADGGRPTDPQARVWVEWMRRLVDAAGSSAEPAQLALIEFLRSRPWPMRLFRATVGALLRAERLATARDAVAVAARVFPQNSWVQVTGEEIRRRLEADAAAVPEAASLPAELQEETAFFERLDAMVSNRQWEEASRLVRDLRAVRPAPAWLDAREPDLWLALVLSNHGRGHIAGMTSAARMCLGGDESRAERLLAFASDVASRGDKSSAILVVKEVLRRFPTMELAMQLLAQWEPQPAAERNP